MSLPSHVAVEVDFNVSIDAESKVILFGDAAPVMQNVIVAEKTLPVTALFDDASSVGLIEIWEPSDAQGKIRCQLANNGGADGASLAGAYKVAARRLAQGIQELLCDEFDCSGATPFDEYTANVEYYKQRDFGRVALGAFAHYLFGHVDATAAITNDVAFVQNMLSVTAGGADESAGGPAARYAAWSKVVSGDVESWDFASTNLDANLALRLVEAIVAKGKAGAAIAGAIVTSDVSGADTAAASLANIVKQVIGQDSSRANSADGSERTLDKHILLRFYAGDVIYVQVNVKKPTVEVTGTGTANGPANTLVQESETAYVLKITLA
jgi:hypothetical protein